MRDGSETSGDAAPPDDRQVPLRIRIAYVPEDTIFELGLIAGPGIVIFYLCGLWFVTRLRLSRERYAEIS